MARTSINEETEQGLVKNGYDYDRQCWIIEYIIQPCNHNKWLVCCCYGAKNAYKDIRNVVNF